MRAHLKKVARYFLPHPETHQKAHLLSWHFLLIYILLFILLRTSFDLISIYRPGVLGISSNITTQQIIEAVNKERKLRGLPALQENQSLSQAAQAKANNMFEENYWAHFSPSGADPWKFIQSAGYKFSYAGENLARNFYNPDEVIKAWMNSPSHRANILNPQYQDIGIAVSEGVLQGQNTTLIVQMFGTPSNFTSVSARMDLGGEKVSLDNSRLSTPRAMLIAGAQNEPSRSLIDPFITTKVVGIFMIGFVAMLLIVDFIILRKRGVFRLSSHHLAHLGFLAIAGTALLASHAGEIL